MRDRMEAICEAAGDDAAILVPIDGILSLMMSVPVGVWCDVPSAGGLTTLEPADVAELAIAWAKEGRDLFVLSSSETPLMNELIPSGIVGDTTSLEPPYPTAIETTITSRPTDIVVDRHLGKGPDGEPTFHPHDTHQEAPPSYPT